MLCGAANDRTQCDMKPQLPESLRRYEIPGCVVLSNGQGDLPKINVTSNASTAEIYLHGAHVTGFQKTGEPPLLFMSAKSLFATDKAIRGGVPICFPWFGSREGLPAHGFARVTDWELVATDVLPDGGVSVRLRLPENAGGRECFSRKSGIHHNRERAIDAGIAGQKHDDGAVEL